MKSRIVLFMSLFALAALACGPVHAQTTPRDQAEALFVEAQKSLSRGDSDGAEKLLTDALAKDASFTSAIWQLALVHESKGKLDYARELLLRGLRQEPEATWAREKLAQLEGTLARSLLSEAMAAMNAGEYSRAIPKLKTYLGLKPGSPRALVSLGKCSLAKGDVKAAREYLQKARASDPAYEEIPSLAAAIDGRETTARLDRLIGEAQTALADTARGADDRARAALQAVIEEDPGNSWARERLQDLADRAERAESEKAKIEKRRLSPVVARGRKALDQSAGYVAPIAAFAIKHLLLLLLAAVLCVLIIDVRRRIMRRSHPLEGTISLIPILDIVSLVNANLRSGRLLVVGPDSRGEIYFEKGEIIHAQCEGLSGKLAFHKLMEIRSGRFFFHNHLPNVRRTIADPLSILLLSMKPNEGEERDVEAKGARESAVTASR